MTTYIKGNVESIKKQIIELQDRINSIQTMCSHPSEALEIEKGSNTGNYDPSNDCYWTDYYCHLCQKRWHEYR